MSTRTGPALDITLQSDGSDFAAVFHAEYSRIARVIARIVQDSGRAEDLASEVFWKFWRQWETHTGNPSGWLYRVAIRMSLDELRRRQRREKYERLFSFFGVSPSPEQLHAAAQDRQHVQVVLAVMKTRDSELLILRSEGLSYQEIAGILQLNETSIGTLLRRAQDAFRKEYVKRYGQPN